MKTIDTLPRAKDRSSQIDLKGLDRRIDQTKQWFASTDEDHLGHLESELKLDAESFLRFELERAAQAKADATPPECPRCGAKLTKCRPSQRTIQTSFGKITIQRVRGWCAKCEEWFVPADHRLGIERGYSPSVQEMAALFASKMPVAEASKMMKKTTGIPLPEKTLERVAKKAADKAQHKRRQMDKDASQGRDTPEARGEKQPETLIIEIDAWNIRERDDWGQSERLRKKGKDPKRWHWVWTATVFSLEHRLEKNKRPIIVQRGYVATREGLDALREQLHAEAMRRGLSGALRVIVIGDGAAWIWNLAGDRFPEAVQRLDLYHLREHLHELSRQLHPDEQQAERWRKQMKRKLDKGQAAKVVASLEEAVEAYAGERREEVERELNYFKEHAERMDYKDAADRGEPVGSGAIESTCRQYQCRFKRPGQFWSRKGDEAYLCLDTFWRNERWGTLFPPCSRTDVSQN